MADVIPSTPSSVPLPLTLIDLRDHPDEALLETCRQATKLRDHCEAHGIDSFQCPMPHEARVLFRLTSVITATEAMTPLGLQTKAIFVMGEEGNLTLQRSAGVAPFSSVIRDFLRMGGPT